MHTFNTECSLVVDFGEGGHEVGISEDQRKGPQGWGVMKRGGKIKSLDFILSARGIHGRVLKAEESEDLIFFKNDGEWL